MVKIIVDGSVADEFAENIRTAGTTPPSKRPGMAGRGH
jgi:hypothetical protein